MPPYLLAVAEDAWENSWNSLPICSAVMPMPVSVTAIVIQSRPSSVALLAVDGDGAVIGKLVGVAEEVEQRLPDPDLVGMHHPDRSAMDCDLVAVLRRQRLRGLDHVSDQRLDGKGIQVQLHSSGLDLGEVENVVDQGEQVAARAEHAIERFEVLLRRLGILAQHLGDADDGVERRAQLVAHVGEELRLVLARLGELAALVLDFVEQPHVLDRDRRLVGEGRRPARSASR